MTNPLDLSVDLCLRVQSLHPIVEDDAMKKLKRYAQVDINGEEGLYETTIDRWSRNAKHQLSKGELAGASSIVTFEEGENALYEGHPVEIRIPQGPKGTMGVIFEGKLKMVHHTKIKKIDEGVMGGVQTMSPINRIMQLAGLEHTGVVSSDQVVSESGDDDSNETLTEANLTGTFNQLLNSVPAQFRDNPEAARLYVMGSLISVMAKDLQTAPLQTKVGMDKMKTLKLLGPMGADLVKSATDLTKKVTATPTVGGLK
jgi:hypothetical protein